MMSAAARDAFKRRVVGARGFEPPTSRSRTVRATRLRYAQHRPNDCTESGLPRILAHQRDEHTVTESARAHLAAHALHQRQDLPLGVAERQHHAPALGELLEKWWRDAGASGGDEDPIERGLVGPAQRAVSHAYPHVGIPEAFDQRPLAGRQRREPLELTLEAGAKHAGFHGARRRGRRSCEESGPAESVRWASARWCVRWRWSGLPGT